ncbi:MAG: DUF3575 domain-containing protein [Rikenellaceae bacterium]
MKKVTSILLLLLLCCPAYSQTEQKSDVVKIYFDHDSHIVNLDLRQNRESLSHLSDLIETLSRDTLSTISKIEINSYTSPEGGRAYNDKLSERRSNSIYDYLTNIISVPDSLIDMQYSGTVWSMLQVLVEESDMQYKDEVLYILKNVPDETWRRVNPNDRWLTLVDSRNKHLMDLKYGNPYRWMFANLYPDLRNGSMVTIYYQRKLPPIMEIKEGIAVVETVMPELVPKLVPQPEPEIKPLLAVKTNLLYDAVTALNVELEIPIGERWSIAGEWMFPWWTSCGNKNNSWQSGENSNRNASEILNANIEVKYWFGDRTNCPVMTGWHLGPYGGVGKYDLEREAAGYQGEFYVIGLSGGYAHTINKKGNLRMEYSLGVGYMNTDYRYYEEHWGIDDTWHTLRQNSGTYSWLGPTRARVSLVWMLNHKVNKEK